RSLPRAGRPSAHQLADALMQLVEQRHAEYNGTFYQLEPDVKNAPGGLRDIAAARWLKTLIGDEWPEAARFDERRLYQAEDFLMRIRSILHLESKRDSNVLSHALQETVADVLRFGGANSQQQVEGLMGEYFRHARAVSRVLTWASRTGRAGPASIVPVAA